MVFYNYFVKTGYKLFLKDYNILNNIPLNLRYSVGASPVPKCVLLSKNKKVKYTFPSVQQTSLIFFYTILIHYGISLDLDDYLYNFF